MFGVQLKTNVNSMLFISSAYILGLISFLSELEIVFAACMFVILSILVIKEKFTAVFCIALYFLFMSGILNAHLQIKDGDALSRIAFANDAVIEGRVISIPRFSLDNTRLRFSVAVDKVTANSKVHNDAFSKTLVTLNDDAGGFEDIRVGDYVRIKGNLRKPFPARNPSQFDYGRYLKFQNIFTTFYAKPNVETLSLPSFKKQPWWAILRSLDVKRDEILLKHAKNIKSPRLEVIGGIVFGDGAVNTPDEVKEDFIRSGLLHLLAASGLNVGLIFGLWWFAATKFGLPYRISIISGMFCVILYTFMTGFPPSILRASIMILIVLIGKLWHKEANTLALVFFVALLMLLIEPKMIVNVGFQLSFLVTIGLLTCVEPIGEKFESWDSNFKVKHKEKHPLFRRLLDYVSPKYLAMALAVPVVAQIWVAPLQSYYFNTFTPYSIFANIAVTPFIGIMSFLGFLSSVLAPIPFDFIIGIFDFFINPLAGALLSVSSFFSSLPNAILTVPSPSILTIILYYPLVILLVMLISQSFRNKRSNITFAVILLLFSCSLIRFEERNFEILAYDVGNADSFLIKTKQGKYIMIDTAKLPYRGKSQAEYIMLPHIKDKGLRSLELLVITHFDNDHSGGVLDILNTVDVKKIVIAEEDYSTKNSYSIMKILKDNKKNYSLASNGEVVYEEPDFKLKTFVADVKRKNYRDASRHDNENSVLVLIETDDTKSLFMADAGADAFEKLKDVLPRDIDILKVGHHGAKNALSTSMTEHLRPKYSIISTGYNQYGHPDYSTIKYLEDIDSKILNTNHLGAVKLVKKGKNFEIYHYDKKNFRKIQ